MVLFLEIQMAAAAILKTKKKKPGVQSGSMLDFTFKKQHR